MMPSETDIKRVMVKEVKAMGGYGRRVEDQYAVGILDTVIVPPGSPTFFCEVKLIKAKTFAPTPRQYIEMKRIEDCKSPHTFALLVGWKADGFFLHPFVERLDDQGAYPSRCVHGDGWTFIQTLDEWYKRYGKR